MRLSDALTRSLVWILAVRICHNYTFPMVQMKFTIPCIPNVNKYSTEWPIVTQFTFLIKWFVIDVCVWARETLPYVMSVPSLSFLNIHQSKFHRTWIPHVTLFGCADKPAHIICMSGFAWAFCFLRIEDIFISSYCSTLLRVLYAVRAVSGRTITSHHI